MMGHESDRITTAVLLAAGTGSRLQPLTHDAPKCLTEVSGAPILERFVRCLYRHDFRRLVVVVGHQERCIREFLSEHARGLRIDYVVNRCYRTTNNMYSLWLARRAIQEPFVLVECDLVFDPSLLEDMLVPNKIAVSPILPWMKGTTVTTDVRGRVTAFHVGSGGRPKEAAYKTVNIYSFSSASWRRVRERLERHVSEDRLNDYYETVFEELVAEGDRSFQAVFFDPERWYEVDTLEDLRGAERLFPEDHTWTHVLEMQ